MNEHHLGIEQHYRFSADITNHMKRALDLAESQGSLGDWLKAIETSIKVQEFAGKELVRYRLRKSIIECASLLAGEMDGQENLSLGCWADSCMDADEVTAKAESIIQSHRELY